MTTPPRVAVVGTGHWGKNLARNFHALGALAAICETDAAARAAQSALYPEAVALDSIDAALADPTVAAVAIATPAATHGALVSKALTAGKHVFVEKPLCLDVAEGAALGKQAAEDGLTLMVGHLLLYHPAFQALKAAVAEGRLGKLRYMVSNRLSLGKIRREENALWSFAPHDISMILQLAGGVLPSRVVSNGGTYLSPEVADTTLSHLTFGEGLQAHLFVSWLHPYKNQELVVIGEKAMAVFDDVTKGEGKLMLYPHQVGWEGEIPAINKAEGVPIPYGDAEPLRNECAHFLDCVATGRAPNSNAEEGLRVLTVLDACQRSLSSGQPVVLSE